MRESSHSRDYSSNKGPLVCANCLLARLSLSCLPLTDPGAKIILFRAHPRQSPVKRFSPALASFQRSMFALTTSSPHSPLFRTLALYRSCLVLSSYEHRPWEIHNLCRQFTFQAILSD